MRDSRLRWRITACFTLEFNSSGGRDLRSIPRTDVVSILDALNDLQHNPHPTNAQPLTGRDAWRVRIVHFRAIYVIEDDNLITEAVKVGHRKDIYR